jgi:hypothetical protein
MVVFKHTLNWYRKRYVEGELAKRLGKDYVSQDSTDGQRKKVKTLEEIALEEAVPRKGGTVSDPGVQFVAGVSEVALDIHHKLKNIEATERAKAQLLSADGDLNDSTEHDGRGNRHEFQRSQFPSQFGKSNSTNRKKARI